MNPSDTPKTDALDESLANHDWAEGYGVLLGKTKELERERNSLSKELEEYRIIAEKIGATKAIAERDIAIVERDQLRRVCDQLAEELELWWNPVMEGYFHPDNPVGQVCYALEAYNQLPHVKEKNI